MLSPAFPRAHQAMRSVLPSIIPRQHQAIGCASALMHFELGGGFALFHDMGTGKTLTAMSTFAILAQRGDAATMFVACPTSVIGAWLKDAEHCPSIDVVALTHKQVPRRIEQLEQIRRELDGHIDPAATPIARGANDPLKPLIVVTNIEASWRMKDAIKAFGFDMVVVDESQRIKAAGSNQSIGMHSIAKGSAAAGIRPPKYRMIMTGTPASEGTRDIYGQYRFLDSRIFGTSFVSFTNDYFTTVMAGNGRRQFPIVTQRQDKAPELTAKMMSVAHVVRKQDAIDLPAELEPRIVTFDLGCKAQKLYDELMAESIAELEDDSGEIQEIIGDMVLTRLLRAQQITGGWAQLDASQVGDMTAVDSGKITALKEQIILAKDSGSRCVVFHRFKHEGVHIAAELAKGRDKISVVHMVAAMDGDERADAVAKFQEAQSDVFLTQIRLGGLGITLTAADVSMFYSTGYSGEEHEQARARTHRMGQTRPVTPIYFAAKGTVDEAIIEALIHKRAIAQEIMNGGWRRYLRGV